MGESSLETVEFKPERFKSSVRDLRQSVGIGVPDKREGPDIDLSLPGGGGLLIARQNLYVLQTRETPARNWTPVTRVSYTQMGIADDRPVNGPSIKSACIDCNLRGNPDTALVILATVEAARSRVVASLVQQMLNKDSNELIWGDLKPFLNNWGNSTGQGSQKRGRTNFKPLAYGALGARDYQPEKHREIREAIETICGKGFFLHE